MATEFRALLGTDNLGTTAINLLNSSLAPSTYANYDSALRIYFAFNAEENLPPLKATPATMVRYTPWLGLLGTVAAISMQPYFSAINKYFRDHQIQHVAVGDLMADTRRGLKMLHHRLVPSDTRVPLRAPVAVKALLATYALRDGLTWSTSTLSLNQRFRACFAVCVNYTFFCRAET
jgi:hypothetical protein